MGKRRRIMVTGIAGNLGRIVAQILHRDHDVIGIDRRPFHGGPKDVEHHQLDIRRKAAANVFRTRDIDTVIHLNILHDPRAQLSEHYTFNLYGTTKLLEYCVKYGVKKFIFLSSANIYGPRPESSGYQTEDSPLMASQAFAGIQDLIAVDLLVQSFFWKHPELEVIILRPVHIIGPGIKNAPSNYLRQDPVVTLLGFDPLIQLIHANDVVDVMQLTMQRPARGIYNVAGPGVVPMSSLLKRLERRTIPLPASLATVIVRSLWKSRLTTFPPPELAHIQFSCLVDDSRAQQELGWQAPADFEHIVHELQQKV